MALAAPAPTYDAAAFDAAFAQTPVRTRRGRRPPMGLLVAAALVVVVALMLWRGDAVSLRPGEQKTVKVVLPPPPPPPPPEVKPVEKPPEPKPMPLETPVTDVPPPPTPQAEPVAGDSALSAREGAGPSNYGLAVGDGGGTRIGIKAGSGDNGFANYAAAVLTDIRRATQADPALARGRYRVMLAVTVDSDGRITTVHLLGSTGSAKRDAEIERRLAGLQLSQRPPAGLPVMRIELNAA
ncbi:TonB C-terminal domain-containing protein [Sphingosinicellaceae bacterium]|nr:TonB C-terminal domain-containing protein [Sphingosinicellaceae bacterium]